MSSDAPLGTIIAWVPRNNKSLNDNIDLPDGWLPCDGSAIRNGPWSGGVTPNLNTNGFFLRGGNENNAMEFEEDQMQDHEHIDTGHSHDSPPHTHSYNDYYITQSPYTIPSGSYYGYGLTGDHTRTTAGSKITINNSKSNIGGVATNYRSGDETRPKNMKVIWIMKCW